MRLIELVPGVRSSALGFGCAPILGAVGAARARKAIHTALDAGITHFDLARSYGYGEAERFVGRILKGERHRVILATKFGIQANWKSQLLRPAKPFVRMLRKQKKLEPIVVGSEVTTTQSSTTDRFHDRMPITVQTLTSSLERSLRELGTDHVDHYFIHEPIETIQEIDAVLSASEKLKSQGKIRAFGLATPDWDSVIHRNYLKLFDVLQFARPAESQLQKMLEARQSESNILFGSIRNVASSSSFQLKQLSKVMPTTVFICSMFTPEHIIANSKQVDETENN